MPPSWATSTQGRPYSKVHLISSLPILSGDLHGETWFLCSNSHLPALKDRFEVNLQLSENKFSTFFQQPLAMFVRRFLPVAMFGLVPGAFVGGIVGTATGTALSKALCDLGVPGFKEMIKDLETWALRVSKGS